MSKCIVKFDFRRSSITSIVAIILVILFAKEAFIMEDKTVLLLSTISIITTFFILLSLDVFRPITTCSSCNGKLNTEIDRLYKLSKKNGEAQALQTCPHCGVTFEKNAAS